MSNETYQNHVVIIIGAGPTGMTVARLLLEHNVAVIMIDENTEGAGGGVRDSIFWDKDKLKLGIMKKFTDTFSHPRFRYYGGVRVGQGGDLTLDELQSLAPVVLTCGSRGDRLSMMVQSNAQGVFDANELVRHLNSRWLIGRTKGDEHLEQFPVPGIGQKVGIVGMGNVVADMISHLRTLDSDQKCGRDITVLVRRGPFASKIAPAEMKWILDTIDKKLLEKEIRRVIPYIIENEPDAQLTPGSESNDESYQQNLQKVLQPLRIKEKMFAEMPDSIPDGSTRVRFSFYSQVADIHEQDGKLTGIKMQQKLCGKELRHIDCEFKTMIFSVGSAVDTALGLSLKDGWLEAETDNPYKVKGSRSIYMAGWARQPSVGLAGIAVKEGKTAEPVILQAADPIEDETKSQTILQNIQNQLEESLNNGDTKNWLTTEKGKQRLSSELEGKTVLSFA